MDLFAEIKSKASGQKTMPQLFQDSNFESFKYYLEKPPNVRLATPEDFIDHSGNYLQNKPYLIHSLLHPNMYLACRTHVNFELENDFETFLLLERVYVFEKYSQ